MTDKKVSVLLIKTIEGNTCLIERDDSKWLSILKSTIKEYLATRFIPDRDSVISFCDQALCLRKLQVLVNTFINNTYPFSWVITSSTLPDFNQVDIQEFLLEPIPDPNAPEPEPIDSLEPVPEPIEEETVFEPSSYEPETVFEVRRRNKKIRELETQIAKKKIEELQAQLEELQNKIEPELPIPVLESYEPINEVVSVLDPCE
jgi:hypothetical protein